MPDYFQTQLPDEGPKGNLLSAGQQFGQYKVIRLLGRGGMGEVYEVEHTVLHRRYALKLIRPEVLDRPSAAERFRREAQVMNHLEHSNIVQVDEFGESEGHTWLRMGLIEGATLDEEAVGFRCLGGRKVTSLEDLMTGQPLPEALVVELLKQILDGLAYAHGKGAIHRDIKPSNILLQPNSLQPDHIQAKITDFGLVHMAGEDWVQSQVKLTVARSMADPETTRLDNDSSGSTGTSTQALLGTFEFMAPEQREGKGAVPASDLYAVGLIAFRMLTGQKTLGFDLPSELIDGLDPRWDNWVRKALAPDLPRRWSDAHDMLGAIPQIAPPSYSEATNVAKQTPPELDDEVRGVPARLLPKDNKTKIPLGYKVTAFLVGAILLFSFFAFYSDTAKRSGSTQAVSSSLGDSSEKETGDLAKETEGRLEQGVSSADEPTESKVDQPKGETVKDLQLIASGTVYVLVKERNTNKELYRKTMTAGEAVDLQFNDAVDILFTAGKHLIIEHDGERFRPNTDGTAKITIGVEGGFAEKETDQSLVTSVEENGSSADVLPVVSDSMPEAGSDFTFDLGAGEQLELVWIGALNGWVGKYEVTNGQYRRFKSNHNSGEYKGLSLDSDKQPVVEVSYHHAVAYAEWLTLELKSRLPKGYHFRLPTGPEWTSFARCGDNRKYYWGNSFTPTYGNYPDDTPFNTYNKIPGYIDGHNVSAPVEKSGMNEWGLFGVGGNVLEWTSADEIVNDPGIAAHTGKYLKVARGGDWAVWNNVSQFRVDEKHSYSPDKALRLLGFRIVLLR